LASVVANAIEGVLSIAANPDSSCQVSVLVDGTEVARFRYPTLAAPLTVCAIPGSKPELLVARIALPGRSETEVFVDGVGLAFGETLQSFESRAPAGMGGLERLTYARLLRWPYVFALLTVYFVFVVVEPGGRGLGLGTVARYLCLVPGMTAVVVANVRFSRMLGRRLQSWPDGLLRVVSLSVFVCASFAFLLAMGSLADHVT
jgi:hypothetical protein